MLSSLSNKFLLWLKISRPGLWFCTIWLYLLPTSQMSHIWESPAFWIGLVYVCFPLNFLVYGWNDIVDYEADAVNPRKDSFLFGAKASKSELQKLWIPIAAVQIVFLPVMLYFIGINFLYLIFAFGIINTLYNLPKNGLRSRPPFELACQIGYLLIVPLSAMINNTDPLPWVTYAYLLLFAWQSHLIGEVMDIEPDRLSNKHTTATKIGMKFTKLLIILIVCIEVALLFFVFKDFIFGAMLALGLIWLVIDLFIIYKTKNYSLFQMKLFAISSNLIAVVSMIYVWYTACLLEY